MTAWDCMANIPNYVMSCVKVIGNIMLMGVPVISDK